MMVSNTIHATYTETYDLNTIQNELSLLAIHTPQSNTLKRFFHGFYEQYSKMKVLGCNFMLSCASKQELDPTLVGFEAGQIDPRDVMNPILFKACTGEGMNALLDQIYNKSEALAYAGSQLGASVDQHLDDSEYAIKAYYSLLADDSWRKAHPQRGIMISGLKPMVHRIVSTQPFKWAVANSVTRGDLPQLPASATAPDQSINSQYGWGAQSGSKDQTSDPVNPSVFVSNGLTEMPWLDTAYSMVSTFTEDGSTSGSAKVYNLQSNIPRVYMGALVLPPSSGAQNLYFRMTMVWHILFKDFRPTQDLTPVHSPAGTCDTEEHIMDYGLDKQNGYFNMYHTPSKLQKDYGSIDTTGIESVQTVLEKVN